MSAAQRARPRPSRCGATWCQLQRAAVERLWDFWRCPDARQRSPKPRAWCGASRAGRRRAARRPPRPEPVRAGRRWAADMLALARPASASPPSKGDDASRACADSSRRAASTRKKKEKKRPCPARARATRRDRMGGAPAVFAVRLRARDEVAAVSAVDSSNEVDGGAGDCADAPRLAPRAASRATSRHASRFEATAAAPAPRRGQFLKASPRSDEPATPSWACARTRSRVACAPRRAAISPNVKTSPTVREIRATKKRDARAAARWCCALGLRRRDAPASSGGARVGHRHARVEVATSLAAKRAGVHTERRGRCAAYVRRIGVATAEAARMERLTSPTPRDVERSPCCDEAPETR